MYLVVGRASTILLRGVSWLLSLIVIFENLFWTSMALGSKLRIAVKGPAFTLAFSTLRED